MTEYAFKNQDGRLQCGEKVYVVGNDIEMKISGKWYRTVVDYSHENGTWYSECGLPLAGREIR